MSSGLVKRYSNSKYYRKSFNLDEIDEYLKGEFNAEIVEDETCFGLIHDPMVNASEIVRLYKISDPKIIEALCTDEEIEERKEIAKEFQEEVFPPMNIALESEDNKYMIGYTVQGGCDKIYKVLMSFRNCPEDNENFDMYLNILSDIGEI